MGEWVEFESRGGDKWTVRSSSVVALVVSGENLWCRVELPDDTAYVDVETLNRLRAELTTKGKPGVLMVEEIATGTTGEPPLSVEAAFAASGVVKQMAEGGCRPDQAKELGRAWRAFYEAAVADAYDWAGLTP